MTNEDKAKNGWESYQKLVLSELTRHSVWMGQISDRQSKIEIDIAKLSVKSGWWGAIGGLVTLVITLIIGAVIGIVKFP